MSNTINTRVKLKYDTFTNWSSNNPVLLKGEIAVVEVPTTQGSIVNVPSILFKVGDGTNNFNALPWASALSADVYDWAKKATKPTYAANEITGLSDFINDEIEDTDTQYQVILVDGDGTSFQLQSKEKNGVSWSDVGDPIKITYTLVEGTTNGTVKFNGTDVAVHGLGSAAYKDTSAFDTAGAANTVKIALLGDSGDTSSDNTIYGVKKYADENIDDAVEAAKTEIIGSGTATSNTIKDAVDESKSYTDTQIAAKISSTYKAAGSVAFASLPSTLNDTVLGNVYNVTDKFTADTRFVDGENGKTYPAGTNVVVIKVDSKYYFDVLAGFVDLSDYATQSYVTSQIGTAKTEIIGSGNATSTTIKGAVAEAKTYADGLASDLSDQISDVDAKIGEDTVNEQIADAIAGLSKTDSAVSKQFVTAVSQSNGIISTTRRALVADDIPTLSASKITGLADIATTGNVDDLIQTAETYVILDCGNSSTNI